MEIPPDPIAGGQGRERSAMLGYLLGQLLQFFLPTLAVRQCSRHGASVGGASRCGALHKTIGTVRAQSVGFVWSLYGSATTGQPSKDTKA